MVRRGNGKAIVFGLMSKLYHVTIFFDKVKSKFVLNLKLNTFIYIHSYIHSIAQLAYLEGILLYMDGAFCTNSLCTCKVDLWGKDTLVDFGNVTFI